MAQHALTAELHAVLYIDQRAYVVGILDVQGADKVGDDSKYVLSIDVDAYLHWMRGYGASTIVLSGTDFSTTTVCSGEGLQPRNYISGDVDNYVDRSAWVNGGKFTKEVTKTSSPQTYSFRIDFNNNATNPTSSYAEVSITVPKREATAHVNVNGVWKDATPYVNVNGAWKEAVPYVNVNGTWKEGV